MALNQNKQFKFLTAVLSLDMTLIQCFSLNIPMWDTAPWVKAIQNERRRTPNITVYYEINMVPVETSNGISDQPQTYQKSILSEKAKQ